MLVSQSLILSREDVNIQGISCPYLVDVIGKIVSAKDLARHDEGAAVLQAGVARHWGEHLLRHVCSHVERGGGAPRPDHEVWLEIQFSVLNKGNIQHCISVPYPKLGQDENTE